MKACLCCSSETLVDETGVDVDGDIYCVDCYAALDLGCGIREVEQLAGNTLKDLNREEKEKKEFEEYHKSITEKTKFKPEKMSDSLIKEHAKAVKDFYDAGDYQKILLSEQVDELRKEVYYAKMGGVNKFNDISLYVCREVEKIYNAGLTWEEKI